MKNYCVKICKFQDANFKNDNFFKNAAKKYRDKAFLVPLLRTMIFAQTLLSEKSEDGDLKSGNSFFQMLAYNYPNTVFLVPSLTFFNFS